MTKDMALGKLVVDETLYPRHKISAQNVRMLVDAYRAGADVPSILVDQKLVIIDGVHRHAAQVRIHGPEGVVSVEVKDYESRQERVKDAVGLNVGRGYNLTAWDQVRAIMLMLDTNCDREDIMATLKITEERMDKLEARIKDGASGKIAIKAGNEIVAAKPKLTKAQETFEFARSPMPVKFHLNQVIGALRAKVVTFDDATIELFEELVERYQEVTA